MNSTVPKIPEHILEQAINWQVKLLSGTASAEVHTACERWRAAAPEHNTAWLALQQLDDVFTGVAHNNALVQHTLKHARPPAVISRRQMLKMLLVGSVIAPAAITGYHYRPAAAGYITAAGQRSQYQLPDGSVLTLNSRSAADIQQTERGIQVVLHSGDAHISTHSRLQSASTTQVKTDDWLLTLQQGEYLFHQRNQRFYAQVQQGEMALTHPELGSHIFHEEDHGWWLDASGLQPYTDHFFDPSGWLNGALVASNMPLPHFLAELNRYRPGWVRHSAAAANLQVSGVFQLADTDNILDALAKTLPVKITKLTSYLIMLSTN